MDQYLKKSSKKKNTFCDEKTNQTQKFIIMSQSVFLFSISFFFFFYAYWLHSFCRFVLNALLFILGRPFFHLDAFVCCSCLFAHKFPWFCFFFSHLIEFFSFFYFPNLMWLKIWALKEKTKWKITKKISFWQVFKIKTTDK